MVDEKQQSVASEDVTGQDIVDTIKQAKTTINDLTAENERLKAEQVRMTQEFLNGGRTEQVEVEVLPTEEDIKQLRKDLYGGDKELSNLEYWAKTLELRKALLAKGEQDPFLPSGHNISPTRMDEESVERLVDGIQHCIDAAEGDSAIFTNELQRITRDIKVR